MRVLGEEVLTNFCESHADVKKPAHKWLAQVKSETWNDPHDVKATFRSVSMLGNLLVVFDLKGNSYRMLTKIDYKKQVVKIRRVGTHAEYSKWKL